MVLGGLSGVGNRGIDALRLQELALIVGEFEESFIDASPENLMGHQQVIAELARRAPILPFAFGTLSPSKAAAERLLRLNHSAAARRLVYLEGKHQYSLNVLWADMKAILDEIVRENREIRVARDQLLKVPTAQTYSQRIAVGHRVAEAVGHKRAQEAERLQRKIRSCAVDLTDLSGHEENFVLGVDVLLAKGAEMRFEKAMQDLDHKTDGRYLLRLRGPEPPLSFSKIQLRVPA